MLSKPEKRAAFSATSFIIGNRAKGASISGFPEWLPSERVVEQRVIDTLREVFELNGFIGIETRAVEQGSSLLKKGETSKEIYLLSRFRRSVMSPTLRLRTALVCTSI